MSNRKQFVQIGGATSSLLDIICGVPQGSILGPLLFLIYINDLPDVCNNTVPYLFADDTNLTYKSSSNSFQTLQDDVDNLHTWLNSNKLSLNLDKTVMLAICSNVVNQSEISIGEMAIKNEDSMKYLGVWIDKNLKLHKHISVVTKKVARYCGIISKIRHWVPNNIVVTFYNIYVKPTIQYGVLIYSCCYKNKLNSILVLQKKICVF